MAKVPNFWQEIFSIRNAKYKIRVTIVTKDKAFFYTARREEELKELKTIVILRIIMYRRWWYIISLDFILLLFLVWCAERCAKTAVLIVLIVTGSIIIRTAPVFHCVAALRCNVAIRSIIPKNRRIINYSIYHNVIRLPVFSRAWGGGGCLLQHCNATLQRTS